MGYFKVKHLYSVLIFSLVFPVFAFGAISTQPSSVNTCPTGECSVPVILSCSPQTDNIVVAGWTNDLGSVSVIGTCDTVNDTDISYVIDWADGGSGNSTIGYCDTSIEGADCVSHEESADFINDAGYLGSVLITVSEQVATSGLFGQTQTASVLMSEIGTVSSTTFTNVLPYAMITMGTYIAFYILIEILKTQPKDKKDRIIRDKKGKQVGIDVSNDGYHRIIGKDGQEKGWAKD